MYVSRNPGIQQFNFNESRHLKKKKFRIEDSLVKNSDTLYSSIRINVADARHIVK